MQGFRVVVNGAPVVTVSTEAMALLSVQIGGSRYETELARLAVDGMTDADEGRNSLFWVPDTLMPESISVQVDFLESAVTSCPGKTMAEIHPDEPEIEIPTEFVVTAEMIDEIRSRPILRRRYAFELDSPAGKVRDETIEEECEFSFLILWNKYHPERARVSVSGFSIDSVAAQRPPKSYFNAMLRLGESVVLHLSSVAE